MAELEHKNGSSIFGIKVPSNEGYSLPFKAKNSMPQPSLPPWKKSPTYSSTSFFRQLFPPKYHFYREIVRIGVRCYYIVKVKLWNIPKTPNKTFGKQKRFVSKRQHNEEIIRKALRWIKETIVWGGGEEGRRGRKEESRESMSPHYLIIHFQTSKHWIFKSHIYSNHMIY